jgi:cytochrome bd-type quinol oxidase subunit 1
VSRTVDSQPAIQRQLAGDEKFFDLLEETLNDSSEDASERLAVYYTCLGLGFMGMYTILSILFIVLVYRAIDKGPGSATSAAHAVGTVA